MTPNLGCAETYFYENFERRGELGASLSVWFRGEEVLSLGHGFRDRKKEEPWTAQTSVLVWSATKGPAAACLNHALVRHGESLETPVSAIWPEFAQAGKESVSFGELLSHQAGMAALDSVVSVLEHEKVAGALAAQSPNWPHGSGHGYHPRTFGFLLDESVRRLEGIPLGEYWRKWFGVPMGLDFWIGNVPDVEISPIYAARITADSANRPAGEDALFNAAMSDAGSLTARAFRSPSGLHGVAAMNTPEARQASNPGFGGIGTASALGKFYAMLAEGGTLDGVRYFDSIRPMTEVLTEGDDLVLLRKTAFAAGFMHDPLDTDGRKLRQLFGPSPAAFGQPGAGGSHAFADPENRIAFAYVMNQMESGVFPNEKSTGLIQALYSELK